MSILRSGDTQHSVAIKTIQPPSHARLCNMQILIATINVLLLFNNTIIPLCLDKYSCACYNAIACIYNAIKDNDLR